MKLGKKTFFERVINILLNILIFIFTIIFLIIVYTGFQTKILGNNYSNFFGYSMFEVQTGSMSGTINPGDWIIVKLTKDIKLNDVITYEANGDYITHRVIEMYNGEYTTKGDANNAKDKIVTQDQIVGKVVNILHNLGIMRKIFFNPGVVISLIIALFFTSYAIRKSKAEKDNAKKVALNVRNRIFSFVRTITKKIRLMFGKKRNGNNKHHTISDRVSQDAETITVRNDTKDDDEIYRDEDELDKTSTYRVLSVDLSETDRTRALIAKTKFRNEHKYWYIKIVTNKIVAFANMINKKTCLFFKSIAKKIKAFSKLIAKQSFLLFKSLIKNTFKLIIWLIKNIVILIFLIIKKTCILLFLIVKGIYLTIFKIIKSFHAFIVFLLTKIVQFFAFIFKKIYAFFKSINEFREYKRAKMMTLDNIGSMVSVSNKEDSIASLMGSDTMISIDQYKEDGQDIEKAISDENKEMMSNEALPDEIISVDSAEIDNTLLEIAEHEVETAKQAEDKGKMQDPQSEEKQKKLEQEVNESKEDDESLAEVNLDFLKSSKGKNIIDNVMLIKKEELTEIIDILDDNDKKRVHETFVKEAFMTAYINAKYYNDFGDVKVEKNSKSTSAKIERVIKDVSLATELMYSSDNDTKYHDMVEMYTNIFMLIVTIDQARDSITDSKAKFEFYKNEIKEYFVDWDNAKVKYVINEIFKTQKNYVNILNSFFRKLETNMFILEFNKLTTKKDMYGLKLEHDITFSKIYSEYIIDKTYTEGIIAEDKMTILLTLLSTQLVKDMFLSNFNKKYILYMPTSLYAKEKKLNRLLRMIDDKYAKDNVIILIKVEELLKNKQVVTKIRKEDYKFALVFNEATIVGDKNRGNLYIADYIFVNKKKVDMEKMLSYIPEDLLDKVIHEDIVEKVGDFGSE